VDADGYRPLATLVARRVEERVAAEPGVARALVVGIGGGVAVGKSTTAAYLAELLRPVTVEIVGTDGFLLSNAVLEARGLLWRKGFPESYDDTALRGFLLAARRAGTDLAVPVYDHQTYDVVADVLRPVPPSAVIVVEGVNALRYAAHLDLGVYLHAEVQHMEAWYAARFLDLCEQPPPGSFYEHFRGLDLAGREAVARDVWRSVNLVNLREHILPTRAAAAVVVEKAADHTVTRTSVVERA